MVIAPKPAVTSAPAAASAVPVGTWTVTWSPTRRDALIALPPALSSAAPASACAEPIGVVAVTELWLMPLRRTTTVRRSGWRR